MTVTIATRQYQLVPLTHAQVDQNFINLAGAVNANENNFTELSDAGGSATVGNGGETVADSFNALQMADYAALRAYSGPRKSVYVTGYLVTGGPTGIAGEFVRDDSDTVSTDNGGTLIVSNSGVRWKRQYRGGIFAAWFGAIADGVHESSAPIMAALAVAKSSPVILDSGTYLSNSKITIKGNDTDGYQKLYGQGWRNTEIWCYASDSGIQSDQGLADYCEVKGFSIINKASPGTQIGIDMGTARNSKLKDILSKDFLIAFALSKNVDPVGNYYNSLQNLVADCGAAPAGSIGFQFGNVLVGHSNPTSNANNSYGCRSYGCETAIWINGSGNTIQGHMMVSCKKQVVLVGASYNNYVEGYCESQTGVDSMGSAEATTVGNTLSLFNDALNLTQFVDHGWNNILGNVQAGGRGYPLPSRTSDFIVADHISMEGVVGANIPVFSINLPDVNGSIILSITFDGIVVFTGNYGGCMQTHIVKKASGTPAFSQIASTFDAPAKLTLSAAADGTVTCYFAGDAVNYSTVQFTVAVQGVTTTSNGLGTKISYARLV